MTTHSDDDEHAVTVVAVCGCGHDGRLGLGRTTTTASTSRITLVPAFLPCDDTTRRVDAAATTTTTTATAIGRVRSVHCGAYHTLVHTTRGLYGWGSNDDGQLGLGGRVASVDAPTRLTFFDARRAQWRQRQRQRSSNNENDDNDDDDYVVRVCCGAKHSVVQTADGLYVSGCNEYGQLGLAHTHTVHTWTLLCTLPLRPWRGGISHDASPPSYERHDHSDEGNEAMTTSAAAAADMTATHTTTTMLPGTFGARVVGIGDVTHVSCGTHHTVLACRDVLVRRHDDDNNSCDDDDDDTLYDGYAVLLLACGLGDYGELGYDGDAWQVQRTRDERARRALLLQQQQQQQQQQQPGQSTDDGHTATTMTLPTACARWAAKQRRLRGNVQRRAPLTSSSLQPVNNARLRTTATRVTAATLHAWCNNDNNNDHERAHAAWPSRNGVLAVRDVRAMHLHTAVTLLHTRNHHHNINNNETRDERTSACVETTYHWGCYYGRGVIDDVTSSQPRRVDGAAANRTSDNDDDNDNNDANDNVNNSDDGGVVCGWRLHAACDVALRYRDAHVDVVGCGVVGRGGDEDDVHTWTRLHYNNVKGNNENDDDNKRRHRRRVVHVTGRSHILLLEQTTTTTTMTTTAATMARDDDDAAAAAVHDVVYGFGDNLHGQLGSHTHDHDDNDSDSDGDAHVVLRPRRLLQCGDMLHAPAAASRSPSSWRVQRIRDVGAGAAHSVFVVDVPIGLLYSALTPQTRRLHIRPHKSFAQLLQRVRHALDIELDDSGIRYRICGDTAATTATAGVSSKPHRQPTLVQAHKAAVAKATATTKAAKAVTRTKAQPSQPSPSPSQPSSPSSSSLSSPLSCLSPETPPVDFYYDAQLASSDVPPPPNDFATTPAARAQQRARRDGAVLSLATFAHYIPPFFVPLHAVLATMPGYTEQHIDRYFDVRVIELVRVASTRYIRLHGGAACVPLCGHADVAQRFAAYKPDVALVDAFVNAFAGVYETWLPLRQLLARVPAATRARLPFRGAGAIVYFAQMQHVFAFAVNPEAAATTTTTASAATASGGDGGSDKVDDVDCTLATTTGTTTTTTDSDDDDDADEARCMDACAVLLRRPGYSGLDAVTTPTPVVCNYLLQQLPQDTKLDVTQLAQRMPDELRDEVVRYYGSLVAALRAHAPLFHLSDDATVVMPARYYARMQLASRSLEEQLVVALQQRNRHKAHVLRRRIAMRDCPTHPLHDRDNLAREISHYLPPRGFVVLRSFLRRQLPEELHSFLPNKLHNFFAAYPQYFQQFEYRQPGMWCLSRPGEPLPRGVVRDAFSEDDVVRLVAAELQPRGSATCTALYHRLPHGAQEYVRRQHGGLYFLVLKYPQYFNVVLSTELTDRALSYAVVHLLQLPPAAAVAAATATTTTAATTATDKDSDDDEEGDDDDDDDEHD